MTSVPAAADRGHRAVRVVLITGIALGGLIEGALSSRVAAAVPASEVAAGLVPFSGWVGRLPADQEETWKLREELVFYRGRLGVWMEAELQAASSRLPIVRQFELRVALARAARFNGEWDRARGWSTAAGETLARVPAEERTWPRLAAYYTEAVALREIKDVRVAYAGLKDFLDGELPPADRFEIYRRLVDMAVITGDKENYSKLATALLTSARAWNEVAPAAAEEPSDADVAMAAYAETLLRRGQAETAIGLLDIGIANKALRQTVADAAMYARLAQEPEPTVTAYLANQSSPRERLEVLAPPDARVGGLAVWLARMNRTELVREILAGAREEPLTPLTGADRDWWERTWNDTMQRVATTYFHWGRPQEAVRLGELYVEPRPPGSRRSADSAPELVEELVRASRLLDRNEGLVAFARLLGDEGEPEAARRLLIKLPFDFPRAETIVTAAVGERAIREHAAESSHRQKQVALVSAWAASGDSEHARELLDDLPKEDPLGTGQWNAVRQQLWAEVAAAAAIEGDTNDATGALDNARRVRPGASQYSFHVSVALVTALVLNGQPQEAWDEVTSAGEATTAVVETVVEAVLKRGRCNRVLEWVSVAREDFRPVVWSAFFRVAVPDPTVPPVAPE